MSHKVLQLCLSTGAGGLELYLARIIAGLKQDGWQVYGVAMQDTRIATYMNEAGIEFKTFTRQRQALLSVYALVRWMKQEDIRVVHCHKSSDLRLTALMKCLWPSLRVFYTDHVGSKRAKKDPFHRWAYSKLDRVLSISDATRTRNVNALPLPSSRITRLHHGIEVDQWPPVEDPAARRALLDELGIPADTRTICLPARVASGKGHEVWLDALSRLPASVLWHGVILGGMTWSDGGEDTYVTKLETQIRTLGLEGRITFTGHRTDLRRLLPAFDILCIPSRNEAFGLTVIESMASGRPVIGSDSGAIPELLAQQSGLLAQYDDPAAWAEAMLTLLKDPDAAEALGQRGRKRAVNHFSQVQHVEKLGQLYSGQAPYGEML